MIKTIEKKQAEEQVGEGGYLSLHLKMGDAIYCNNTIIQIKQKRPGKNFQLLIKANKKEPIFRIIDSGHQRLPQRKLIK